MYYNRNKNFNQLYNNHQKIINNLSLNTKNNEKIIEQNNLKKMIKKIKIKNTLNVKNIWNRLLSNKMKLKKFQNKI